MGQIVFACVAPHGWLLVPQVAGPDGARAEASRAAMAELGRRMEAAAPDTVVVVEPHGLHVEGCIALFDALRVAGRTGGPPDLGATRHGYALDFAVDRALLGAIAERAKAAGVPAVRVRNALDFLPLPIDYGVMTPLWYLGAAFARQPEVVAATIAPRVARDACLAFGRAVREAAEAGDRRIAFVASADLAHAHSVDSRFGFDPAAAACDAAVVAAAGDGTLEGIESLSRELVVAAKTELAPLLALRGALAAGGFRRGEVLSYEVPTYFGMLCAAFQPA